MSESTPPRPSRKDISRRDVFNLVFKGGGLAVVGIAAHKLLGDQEDRTQTTGVAEFLLKRDAVDKEHTYLPPNPEEPLSRQFSDRIFDQLELSTRYPGTINKETFHLIVQRPARIVTLYTSQENPSQQDFENNCMDFFGRMNGKAQEMDMDFIATLLMFQVSGDANNSVKAQRRDTLDEGVRTGLSLADSIVGNSAATAFVSGLRLLNMGGYYSMPRLEGPVTLGIHDIETIMIARSLLDLEKSLPLKWQKISRDLEKQSPGFFAGYKRYAEMYERFEKASQEATAFISESAEVADYLRRRFDISSMQEVLTKGNSIDPYQFTRSTTYWAVISELDQMFRNNSYSPERKQVEQAALDQTLKIYANSGAIPFILDQLGNPRIIKRLKTDAEEGSVPAKKLLDFSLKLQSLSDAVISEDRALAGDMMSDGTEKNLEFQMITGVAYTRWLIHTQNKLSGIESNEIKFNNPNELAWTSFVATMDREIAASFLLSGVRPLERASLPFIAPEISRSVIDDFLGKVYLKHEKKHPKDAFKPFAKRFLNLLEERYFRHIVGVRRYDLDDNESSRKFIEDAVQFGYEQNLITIPHCSSMRAFEATAGYISSMT